MSRNAALSPSAPRRPSQWTSHLRQFSKSSTDRSSFDVSRSPDTSSQASSSTAREPQTPRRNAERICTVSINESVIRDELLLNLDLVGGGAVQPGTLMSITPLKSDMDRSQNSYHAFSRQPSYQKGADDASRSDRDVCRRYIFVAKDMSKELKVRHPTVEVYVAKHIGDAFHMKKGTQVVLAPVNDLCPAVEASHVELSFKDMYLSRADMWRLAISDLVDRTVYKGQVVYFMGTIKATVATVFVEGREVHSAFFGRHSRPIFRSESARYVLFIQMAKEMWDFDSDGSGEIMFYKVVNGFLPALFKKWAMMQVKHLVSIVLFSRVEYDTGLTTELANTTIHNEFYTGFQTSGNRRPYKDFYRIVVSQMSSGEWPRILHQLKKEFNMFRRDISLYHRDVMSNTIEIPEDSTAKGDSACKIKAESSTAMYGNLLEAINLASSIYAHDYIDRDLLRTGISIVIISPGSGVFEVEYESLRRTTEALIGNGIGIDLICIPNLPLHSVPLFRYRNPHFLEANQRSQPRSVRSWGSTPKQPTPLVGSYNTLSESLSPTKGTESSSRGDSITARVYADEWAFALPQWLHVSYWTGKSEDALSFQGVNLSAVGHSSRDSEDEFTIRCRLYDLQMRSVLETNEIETAPLHSDTSYSNFLNKPGAKRNTPKPDLRAAPTLSRNRKATEALFEPVYGFQKFVPDKLTKTGETSMWKQLQSFDESRAKLPLHRRLITSSTFQQLEESTKRQLMEDTGLFGTSVGDKRTVATATRLSSSIPPSNYVEPEVIERGIISRRTSVASTTQPKIAPLRTPKLMRQISLGQRGFGIAAPKVVTAEVKIEHVNALQTTGPAVVKSPSTSRIAPTTPVTPARSTFRPASRTSTVVGGTPQTFVDISGSLQDLDESTPTRPIQIKVPPLVADPLSTLKSGPIPATPIAKSSRPQDLDLKFSNQLREEDHKRLYNSKLRAGGVPELPSTLSPTTAMAPWLVVLNPSNPNTNKIDNSVLFSRWQHVFPRPSDMRVMKWKSLSCPAAVPLTTEHFPTQAQFNTEYQRQPYNIAQDLDDELAEEPKSRAEFLRDLVSARLAHGFQVVIGPSVAKAFDQKSVRIADIFAVDNTVGDGTSIFMSIGNTVHQLSCVNGTEVEVNIYVRKPTEPLNQAYDTFTSYKPAVRTLLDETYQTVETDIMTPKPERNWNYIDSYLAGHTDEMTENLRYWRARFVLIPMFPVSAAASMALNEDDEEEVRLEGIKRLAQTWQRHRYLSPSERYFQSAGARKRDPNPLDIIYKTEDPSVVIAAELEELPIFENVEPTHRKGLVSNRERFSKSNFNLASLAEAIQQPLDAGGIQMRTRRWHFRLHYHCFIGSDMTTWLLDNFEDLDSREEAVELGNSLMVFDDEKSNNKERDVGKDTKKDRGRGLFVHVEKRHPFRDGQYFYQIVSDYAKPHSQAWFGSRRKDASVPSTPSTDAMPLESPRLRPRPISSRDENSPESGSTTPTLTASGRRPKVVLSKMMKYDVDHRKKSYRPERINLHYDRLHNPDSCFHIRIDWMNVTAKLVEDAIKTWAGIAVNHGLRLVELPIAEACSITETNPFRRPYRVKLARQPPAKRPFTYYDPTSLTPQAQPGKNFWQKALLKKFDYVLDLEAASNFPSNVDVSYSWGKPDNKYCQYIHRSGILIAEITDEGEFLLLANRLYSNRAAAFQQVPGRGGGESSAASHDRVSRLMASNTYGNHGLVEPTPISSPLFRPALFATQQASSSSSVAARGAATTSASRASPSPGGPASGLGSLNIPDPEVLKDALELFCADEQALDAFYEETLEKGIGTGVDTPGAKALATSAEMAGNEVVVGVADANIPTLGLPPGLFTNDGGDGPQGVVSSFTPRIGTPSLTGAQLFRRGSVQYDGNGNR